MYRNSKNFPKTPYILLDGESRWRCAKELNFKSIPANVIEEPTDCALIVLVVSIIISVGTLKIQRTHNEKSVKPFGQIILNDYENQITIDIRNVGIVAIDF